MLDRWKQNVLTLSDGVYNVCKCNMWDNINGWRIKSDEVSISQMKQ